MTLQQAIKTGKPFKRPTDKEFIYPLFKFLHGLTREDILADDYYVEGEEENKIPDEYLTGREL